MNLRIKTKFTAAVLGLACSLFAFVGCDDSGGGGGGGGSVFPVAAAPDAPAVTVGDGQLSLTWDPVDDADTYEVWYAENSVSTDDAVLADDNITDTEYLIEGLTNGTTYSIWLKAVNISGTSDFGAMATGIPNVAPDAPGKPSCAAGDEQISVTWSVVDGAASYEVWYNKLSTSEDPEDATLADDEVAGAEYTITGLDNGFSYLVWLRAKNSAGVSGYSPVSDECVPVPAPSAPGKPTILEGDTELSLTWTGVDWATYYEVWYAENSDSTDDAVLADDNVTGASYVLEGLTNGTTYYVWLKAGNSAGCSDFGPGDSGTPDVTQFTVTYYAGDGNTLGTVPVDTSTYVADAEVTVKTNSGNLVGAVIQDGISQRFTGWNTLANGTGTSYAPGAKFNITEDVSLYAIYTDTATVVAKVGPSGGIVFYDAGSAQSWGRYLEACSSDLGRLTWGTNGVDTGADGSAIGTGELNTAEIIADDSATGNAANACNNLTITYNSTLFEDWFLPSVNEMAQVYSVLNTAGISRLNTGFGYWTSTEFSVDVPYDYNVRWGFSEHNYEKNTDMCLTCPVRAF